MILFSIVTISYNNYWGLKKTVASVLAQQGNDLFEYIIVDGGSTDETIQFLRSLPPSVKWVSEKDRGISDAFNKGVRMSSGSAILMLNSGDCFINEGVIMRAATDWNTRHVDLLSYRVKVSGVANIPSTDVETEIYESCTMPHQGTFVAMRCYHELGGYNEEYKIRMDYHFFARCRSMLYSFAYIPRDIVIYEIGGKSMAKKNRVRFWKEGMSIKLLYNVKVSIKDIVKFLLFMKKK